MQPSIFSMFFLFLVGEINVHVNYQLMVFLDEFLGSFVSFPSLVSNMYDMAIEKISQLKYKMLVKFSTNELIIHSNTPSENEIM
jgi:hypothetical protein